MAFQKNECYEMEITGLTVEGNGVGRVDGMAVFVPHTAIGDRCLVRLVKLHPHYAYGKLEQVLSPSADRVAPDCQVSVPCGGCCFRHISYRAELAAKQSMVEDAFARIGGIQAPVMPILGSQRVERYRNKAQYPIGTDGEGKPVAGFYAKRSHRIIPMEDCLLQPTLFGQVQKTVLDFLAEHKISVYQEEAGKGLVRHLYLRYAEATDRLMVCLVVTDFAVPKLSMLTNRLKEQFPSFASLILNRNTARDNVILGRECRTVYGSDTVEDVLCGVRLSLSPLSFYQVNRPQAEVLYQKAIDYAALRPEDLLMDLYCGAGSIGLAAVRQSGCRLLGVEIVSQAVENAKKNAEVNGITASFLCADAGRAAASLAEQGEKPTVIIVDPPRKGLDAQVIEAMVQMAPERIVMVSCNPTTAARDCGLLKEAGYRVQEITPVDLFPRTAHVETVVLLSRQKADDYIRFSVHAKDLQTGTD